jgi:glyoxylase-like metal-dependent hydrolase (beta-lactamase superfamily II)
LVVGDLLFANYFPYVDVENGGNPFKYLENIDWITQNYPNDITVIGGHGPVYSMQQYANYHETLQKTIETVRNFKQKGLTPEQMKEQQILKEWEMMGKFFITEDRWIDTLYPFL